jgi:hypothetical protein
MTKTSPDSSNQSTEFTESREFTWARAALISLGVMIVMIMILRMLGRPWICDCGSIKLWHGAVVSSENSQHISDWYTFSHITHGFLFYWMAWCLSRVIGPLRPVPIRFVLAVVVEAGWEILENTNFIIDRYREATIALDYYGDSILNSSFDVIFMSLGFLVAARIPGLATLVIALSFEIFTAVMIRDNLSLNILMLLWPVEAVKTWQGG